MDRSDRPDAGRIPGKLSATDEAKMPARCAPDFPCRCATASGRQAA